MRLLSRILSGGFFIFCFCSAASAIEYKDGRWAMKLTGYGSGGIIEPDFGSPLWVDDWGIRGQINFAPAGGQTIGAVYSFDAISGDEHDFSDDAFVFFEDRSYGRIELGVTDSVARKLGLGLPDVGGLRSNEKPLFYKKIRPDGVVISDIMIATAGSPLRLNLVSVPVQGFQYGVSFASLANDFDYSADAAIKYRHSDGKFKTAVSVGASFIDNPHNYSLDIYTPNITADWRAQLYGGVNMQYNSWVFATTLRLVYDENEIGPVSDGFSAGAGVSYDILNYSVSLNYIVSDTGVWDRDVPDFMVNTVIGSFRYKYSQNVEGWSSVGITSKKPFLAAGIKVSF